MVTLFNSSYQMHCLHTYVCEGYYLNGVLLDLVEDLSMNFFKFHQRACPIWKCIMGTLDQCANLKVYS